MLSQSMTCMLVLHLTAIVTVVLSMLYLYQAFGDVTSIDYKHFIDSLLVSNPSQQQQESESESDSSDSDDNVDHRASKNYASELIAMSASNAISIVSDSQSDLDN
jgi:hypothetical protein